MDTVWCYNPVSDMFEECSCIEYFTRFLPRENPVLIDDFEARKKKFLLLVSQGITPAKACQVASLSRFHISILTQDPAFLNSFTSVKRFSKGQSVFSPQELLIPKRKLVTNAF